MGGQRFELRYDRWCGWLLGALGTGRRLSRVVVDDDSIRVVMGWAFRATIPRSAVRSIATDDRPVWGWGVHGWRRRWLVNGSHHGLVEIHIDPPQHARTVGVPVRLAELRVSLEAPERFVLAAAPRR